MLTKTQVLQRLQDTTSPNWLRIGFDIKNESALYIVANGGLGSLIASPIEKFSPEIKEVVKEVTSNGEIIPDRKSGIFYADNYAFYLCELPIG